MRDRNDYPVQLNLVDGGISGMPQRLYTDIGCLRNSILDVRFYIDENVVGNGPITIQYIAACTEVVSRVTSRYHNIMYFPATTIPLPSFIGWCHRWTGMINLQERGTRKFHRVRRHPLAREITSVQYTCNRTTI